MTAPRLRGDRLHIGCGTEVFEGWLNLDLKDYPGVQRHDVRDGLRIRNVRYIYAEHFLEHLPWEDGNRFLQDCLGALAEDGVLRLSTPNLDWVWAMQYHPYEWTSTDEQIRDCFWMNKSFRGWGHQFLYNRATLEAALKKAGFEKVVYTAYGVSEHEALRGRESHETYADSPELPHVIVVEASGQGGGEASQQFVTKEAEYLDAVIRL